MKQILIFIFALAIHSGDSAKILTVNTFNSSSHSSWISTIVNALADRGHEVTFVDYLPPKKPTKNVNYLLIEKFPPEVQDYEERFVKSLMRDSTFQQVSNFMVTELKKCERYYSIAPFKQLVAPDFNQTFDLILLNYNLQDCLMALSHQFNAPLVLAAPFSTNPYWVLRAMNTPLFHAVPHYLDIFAMPMNLPTRWLTLLVYLYDDFRYYWTFIPKVDKTLKTYFGKDAPGVLDLTKKAAVALVNLPATNYKIPLPANVIPVGGLHIKPAKPLPLELKEFLDNAKYGAILMSFGSIVRGDSIAPKKREAILKAFSRIRQRVLWKWESAGESDEEDVPQNVKLQKWLPQNDILAHPNIRLFISHCGGMSSMEAAYYGVPILGMPFFLDQLGSADRVVAEGRGLRLDISDVTEESFYGNVTQILDNPMYGEVARRSKIVLQEQPMPPLEKAVFWIEFVARHGGADHMKSPLVDLPWFYSLYLDAILLYSVLMFNLLVSFFLAWLGTRLFKRLVSGSKSKSEKKNQAKRRDLKKNR